MPHSEEYDWMFDYVLQFLESDKFDCSIMDFVDEKCFVFEDEEENKLIYTDIHREFCEHVEALINSNLGELGVTPEMFLESCEKARSGRDINATVFERLVAMDDFQTFKKLMTKRNLELQLEAIRSFKATATPSSGSTGVALKMVSGKSPMKSPVKARAEGKDDFGDDSDDEGMDTGYAALLDPDEFMALKEAQLLDLEEANLQEEEIQELLFQSLMEMEMIHRQEELEHAELERALLLSLAAEEERLRAMVTEQLLLTEEMAGEASSMKGESKNDARDRDLDAVPQSKAEEKFESKASMMEDDNASVATAASASSTAARSSPVKKKIVAPKAASNLDPDAFAADLKPLKPLKPLLGGRGAALPLPSNLSKAVAGDEEAEKMVNELEEKRKAAEEALRRSQQQLQAQKRTEEDLRKQVSGIDPEEAERRARHMQEQRELLLAKKKAEREKRVAAEEEKKRRIAAGEQVDDKSSTSGASFVASLTSPQKNNGQENKDDPSAEEVAEMRRATMRAALARRLKMDLLEGGDDNGDAKNAALNAIQNPLRQLDQLREDNRKREMVLNKQLQKINK
jgi:hypothetical protein